MCKYLEVGDVISIKEGHHVNTLIPEKFVYSARKLSDKLCESDVEIGTVLRCDETISAECLADLNNAIAEAIYFKTGRQVRPARIANMIKSIIPDSRAVDVLYTTDLVGNYVVTKVSGDEADERHVFCQRVRNGKYDPNGTRIDFYQIPGRVSVIIPEEVEVVDHLEVSFS
jgi:hypothetical protein